MKRRTRHGDPATVGDLQRARETDRAARNGEGAGSLYPSQAALLESHLAGSHLVEHPVNACRGDLDLLVGPDP